MICVRASAQRMGAGKFFCFSPVDMNIDRYQRPNCAQRALIIDKQGGTARSQTYALSVKYGSGVLLRMPVNSCSIPTICPQPTEQSSGCPVLFSLDNRPASDAMTVNFYRSLSLFSDYRLQLSTIEHCSLSAAGLRCVMARSAAPAAQCRQRTLSVRACLSPFDHCRISHHTRTLLCAHNLS